MVVFAKTAILSILIIQTHNHRNHGSPISPKLLLVLVPEQHCDIVPQLTTMMCCVRRVLAASAADVVCLQDRLLECCCAAATAALCSCLC